jgi:hypothetical protein
VLFFDFAKSPYENRKKRGSPMHHFWSWLGSNTGQLQAVGSIGAVIAAVALVIVAIKQALAANAQADAARIQADAARAQVDAAKQQIQTSLVIADIQTSPNIYVWIPSGPSGAVIRDALLITNNGAGTASNLNLEYRDNNIDREIPIQDNRLAPGGKIIVQINPSRGVASGFRLTYKTMFLSVYELRFDWSLTQAVPLNPVLHLTELGHYIPPIVQQ